MKYPRIPHDQKRSVRFTLDDIECIRNDYKKYHNYTLVASLHNTNHSTIRYWVNESVRIESSLRSQINESKRLQDPEYRIKHMKRVIEYFKYKKSEFPNTKQWCNDYSKKYRVKNNDKLKLQEQVYREKNRERINTNQKKYRQ